MTTQIPLWVTILIALGAALISGGAVVVGQLVARSGVRQQIEGQNQRDIRAQAREDRHRFDAERRVLYAEFISAVTKADDIIDNTKAKINEELEIESEVGAPIDVHYESTYRHVVEQYDFADLATQLDSSITAALSPVELIATTEIKDLAIQLRAHLVQSIRYLVIIQDERRSLEKSLDAHDDLIRLKELMRSHLGIDPWKAELP